MYPRTAISFLAALLLFSCLPSTAPFSAWAAAGETDANAGGDGRTPSPESSPSIRPAETVQLPPVAITEKSYFALQRAFIYPDKQGMAASITLSLYNGDQRELKATDYWVRLESRSGDRYEVRLVSPDQQKKTVAPKSAMEFTFVAQVGANTRLQDLTVTVFALDTGYANFERQLGVFDFPENYDSLTPAHRSRSISVPGGTLDMYVEKPQWLKWMSGQLLTVSLILENKGKGSVVLPEFQYAVQTAEGNLYALEPNVRETVTIHPQERRTVKVGGTLPPAADAGEGSLYVFFTDEERDSHYPAARFMLPELPDEESPAVPAGTEYPVEIDGEPVHTLVDKVTVSEYAETRQISLYYRMENQSSATVSIPAYGFLLRTGDGLTYPVETPGWQGATVRPKETKQLYMSAFIPADVPMERMTLIVYEPGEGGPDPKRIFPVALYRVEETKHAAGTNRLASMATADGVYQVRLNYAQRLPWENKDQITVDLSLGNEGEKALPVPQLAAYLRLDGVAKIGAQVVRTDEHVILVPGKEMKVMVLGQVPYGDMFKQASLVLQEVNGGVASDMLEFDLSPAVFRRPPLVGSNSAHRFDSEGSRTNMRVRDVYSYSSEHSANHIFYVEMEAENVEKRYAAMPQWAGYFKTDDEQYFPVKVSASTRKVIPGGKVLLAFWGEVPGWLTWDRIQLLVGEAVTGNRLAALEADRSDGEGELPRPDGFVNPALFQVPGEGGAKPSFKELKIGPYRLSLSNIHATVKDQDELLLSFDYTLDKNGDAHSALDGHRLVIDFANIGKSGENTIKFTHEIELETGDGTNVLRLGSGQYEITGSASSLQYLSPSLREYELKLYDQFQGYKRLIGKRTLSWFSKAE